MIHSYKQVVQNEDFCHGLSIELIVANNRGCHDFVHTVNGVPIFDTTINNILLTLGRVDQPGVRSIYLGQAMAQHI